MKRLNWLITLLAVAVIALACTLSSYTADANVGQPATDLAGAKATSAEGDSTKATKVNSTAAAPNDPYYLRQWALPAMKMDSSAVSGQEVIVAILDSGIDANHEDLAGRVIGSVNFTASPTELDVLGHGTHIAGIVAANTNNSIGIAGMASNVKLLNVKIADDSGQVWSSTAAKGITWAVDHGARIINMSFTMPEGNKNLATAVNYAVEHGVVLVAATGNRVSVATYPSAYAGVIGVAALNPDGTVWSGSEKAECIDVYAPGFGIYSTAPGNKYAYKNGSSMASAYVSGLAATMLGSLRDTYHDGSVSSELQTALSITAATLQKK